MERFKKMIDITVITITIIATIIGLIKQDFTEITRKAHSFRCGMNSVDF